MSIFTDLCGPNQATADPEIVACGVRCDEEIRVIRDFARELVADLSRQTTALINSTQSLVATFQAEMRQWITQQLTLTNQVLVSVRDSIVAQTAVAFNELVLQLQFMGLPISNPYDVDITNVIGGATNVSQTNTNIFGNVPIPGQSGTGIGGRNGGIADETGAFTGSAGASPGVGFPGQVAPGGSTAPASPAGAGGSGPQMGAANSIPGNVPGSGAVPSLAPGSGGSVNSGGSPGSSVTIGPVTLTCNPQATGGMAFAGPGINPAALSQAEATGGQVSSQSMSNAIAGAVNALIHAAGNIASISSTAVPGPAVVPHSAVSLPQFLSTVGLTAQQLCQLPAQQQEQVLTGYGQVLQGITDAQKGNDFPVDLTEPMAWQFWGGRNVAWRREAARWLGVDAEQRLFPATLQEGVEWLDQKIPPVSTWQDE